MNLLPSTAVDLTNDIWAFHQRESLTKGYGRARPSILTLQSTQSQYLSNVPTSPTKNNSDGTNETSDTHDGDSDDEKFEEDSNGRFTQEVTKSSESPSDLRVQFRVTPHDISPQPQCTVEHIQCEKRVNFCATTGPAVPKESVRDRVRSIQQRGRNHSASTPLTPQYSIMERANGSGYRNHQATDDFLGFRRGTKPPSRISAPVTLDAPGQAISLRTQGRKDPRNASINRLSTSPKDGLASIRNFLVSTDSSSLATTIDNKNLMSNGREHTLQSTRAVKVKVTDSLSPPFTFDSNDTQTDGRHHNINGYQTKARGRLTFNSGHPASNKELGVGQKSNHAETASLELAKSHERDSSMEITPHNVAPATESIADVSSDREDDRKCQEVNTPKQRPGAEALPPDECDIPTLTTSYEEQRKAARSRYKRPPVRRSNSTTGEQTLADRLQVFQRP